MQRKLLNCRQTIEFIIDSKRGHLAGNIGRLRATETPTMELELNYAFDTRALLLCGLRQPLLNLPFAMSAKAYNYCDIRTSGIQSGVARAKSSLPRSSHRAMTCESLHSSVVTTQSATILSSIGF